MSDDLRTRIVDAAIRIIEREGLSALRTTRVAKEVGVEQGHLTYYFPRKSDLVAGVFWRASQRASEEMMKAVVNPGRHGVRKKLFEVARQSAKDVKRSRLLLGLIVESHGDPELTRPIVDVFQMQRHAFAAILERSPDDLDVELGLAALKGIGLEHLAGGTSAERVDALVDRLEDWFTRADDAKRESRPRT